MKRPVIVALLLAVLSLGLAVVLSRPDRGTPEAAAGTRLPLERLTWTAIPLPEGMQVDALAAEPGHGVVAGRVGEGDSARSVVGQVTGTGELSTVRLVPHTTYGHGARWASVAVTGGVIRAIASRAGGAHLIPRWTVWGGRLDDPAYLEEQVQTFETFGGPAAGGLADIVALGTDAAILGSWESASGGLDVALWRPSGDAWQRLAPDPLLRSTPSREVQASALALTPRGLVVVGAALDLGGGTVTEHAVAWSAPRADGPWQLVRLPARSGSSSAQRLACDWDRCWVEGQDGSAAALWQLAGGSATLVPSPPLAAAARARPMALAAGRLWLATGTGPGLLVHGPDGWRTATPPPGTVTALAADDGLVYAATSGHGGSQLWVGRPPPS